MKAIISGIQNTGKIKYIINLIYKLTRQIKLRISLIAQYLLQASYVGEGLKGSLREGDTNRRDKVTQTIEGMDGVLASFYTSSQNNNWRSLTRHDAMKKHSL